MISAVLHASMMPFLFIVIVFATKTRLLQIIWTKIDNFVNLCKFLLLASKNFAQVREAYNLFNEISDKLFGREVFKGDGEEEKLEDEDDEEEDIDAAFDKEKTELAELRKKTVSGERRFQVGVCKRSDKMFHSLKCPGCREWRQELHLHQDHPGGAT